MKQEEITLSPVSGWEMGTLPQGHVMLSLLSFASEADLLARREQRHRYAMTAAQARELAAALLRAAEATGMGQAPTASRN